MIDGAAVGGATFITVTAAATKVFVSGIQAETSGTSADLFTSMGVFGAALAIAYYMLRRGDKREKEMLDASAVDHISHEQALGEMTSKYISALEELAVLRAEMLELKTQRE